MTTLDELTPPWVNELQRYLPIKTQFFLYGNVYDRFPLSMPNGSSGEPRFVHLYMRQFLTAFFHSQQYKLVGFFDIVDGFSFNSDEEESSFVKLANLSKNLPVVTTPNKISDPNEAIRLIRRVVGNNTVPCAFIIDFASLLMGKPDSLLKDERPLFLRLAKCAQEAACVHTGDRMLNNLFVLIADKMNDLPAWLYMNNPLSKTLEVDRPGDNLRRRYFEQSFASLYQANDIAVTNRSKLIQLYADLTHGMMNRELQNIVDLSQSEQIPAARPREAIERFKFGVKTSPWDNILSNPEKRKNIESAKAELSKHVKGQEFAITAATDIIKRATQGLSGLQHSSKGQRPKGVLFFAGPTGVGKTELAKSIARLLFGDENACIRFDMSEYGQSHSDQKFFGAPPGYIGYEEGGQLTNKVKTNPFSVLLFDEIEKAHPNILDKFLQVLDDGRLTSGRGETVYFSECIIIFTSNKGVYTEKPGPNNSIVRIPVIRPEGWKCAQCGEYCFSDHQPVNCPVCGSKLLSIEPTPYKVLKTRIQKALEEYFKLELGRPEIYNRFGNNFVIFDYIRPDVMKGIIGKMMAGITQDLFEKRRIQVNTSAVHEYIFEKSKGNIELGGRGVGNMIESLFINPLARQLFDDNVPDGAKITVKSIREDIAQDSGIYHLEWTVTA